MQSIRNILKNEIDLGRMKNKKMWERLGKSTYAEREITACLETFSQENVRVEKKVYQGALFGGFVENMLLVKKKYPPLIKKFSILYNVYLAVFTKQVTLCTPNPNLQVVAVTVTRKLQNLTR